jgi:MFS family permease
MNPAPPPPPSSRFQAGTLRYTTSGLAIVFAWLLWGDFCFQMMEMVFLQVMPLKLQSLNAPNVLVSVMLGTIPSTMNLMVNPVISFRSDRFRSRWGRRIPFLLWATPPLTLFLVLLGCSESLGFWLQRTLTLLCSVSPGTVVLCLIALFIMMFQVFNMIICSVYYYLFNDVVPDAFIGRFLSLFRVVATTATVIFEFWIFPHAQSHMREIFIGAAGLYLVAFTMMCLKVKEGTYPPPQANIEGRTGVIAAARTYFLECFNHRFYWDFFLANTFWAVAACTAPFMTFLYLSVGIELGQIGKVLGWSAIISLVLLYPAGMWADRVHPLRIMLLATGILVTTSLLGLIWLFIDPTPRTAMFFYTTYSLAVLPITVLYGAAGFPMYMRLLPKERFGQFCSADAMVRSLALISAAPILGVTLDALKWRHEGDSYYYRYATVWTVTLQAMSLFFLYRVYRYWKRHGGAELFEPPSRSTLAPPPQPPPPSPPPPRETMPTGSLAPAASSNLT